MDYVDLYQIHRFDPETPIDETMEALSDVIRMGKARYIGASSMFAWQFVKMLHSADEHHWSRFISMQNHYNLVYREEEREMIPLCLTEGIGLLPWSPLARGFLAGNRNREKGGETLRSKTDEYAHSMYYQESDFQIVDRVVEIARQKNVNPAQIALAWLLHKPGVAAPIIGASKIAQLEESVAALEIELSAGEMTTVEELYQPHPVLGHH
jgi:aryl-alcohol dehydrogenase (NADP+)